MIPWWAGLGLFVTGAFVGIMIIALLDANDN